MSDWINAKMEQPPEIETVLAIASLNIYGVAVVDYVLAFYAGASGWILEDRSQTELVKVHYWTSLPEPPEELLEEEE